MLEAFMSRHERPVLMFSGGKDSLACLHLTRPWWDKLVVLWVNTQANFPEIEQLMARVRQQVPHFVEVVSDSQAQCREQGLPADVVPVDYTGWGQSVTVEQPLKLQPYLACCATNLWQPTVRVFEQMGVTGVIKGQRRSEHHRAPEDGGAIEVCLPINDWSDKQVRQYLVEQGEDLDDRLQLEHSSLDCWHCTAFTHQMRERLGYMDKHHPEKRAIVIKALQQIDLAVRESHRHLEELV